MARGTSKKKRRSGGESGKFVSSRVKTALTLEGGLGLQRIRSESGEGGRIHRMPPGLNGANPSKDRLSYVYRNWGSPGFRKDRLISGKKNEGEGRCHQSIDISTSSRTEKASNMRMAKSHQYPISARGYKKSKGAISA